MHHRTAQATVAHQLRIEVLTGELLPGMRLLQATVAERMQTSTTPVREALRELAAEGLVDLDPHRGVTIHVPTEDEMEEIYEIRGVLEPLSIRKTVAQITNNEIAEARTVHERACATTQPGEWAVANRDFHALLADASRSPELTSLLANLRNRSALYVAITLRGEPDHISESNLQHQELLAACNTRDEEQAAAIMHSHLGHTVELSHRHLGNGGGGQ